MDPRVTRAQGIRVPGIRVRAARSRKAGWAAGVATALLAAAAMAGCSAPAGQNDSAPQEMSASSQSMAGYDTASEGMAGGSNEAASGDMPAEAPAASSAARPASDSASAAVGTAPLPTGRQIIRTAEVTVTVTVDPPEGKKQASDEALAAAAADAARAVRALVTLPGGYVSGSDGRGSTITVTLRIPAGSYESVMDRLGGIGKISDIAESTQDVTGQLVDVKSRIASQRTSVDRLRALMAKADTIEDVISIESELTRREADLESLEGQQAQLSDAVALSTISVTVDAITTPAEEAPEPEPVPEVKHNAFMTGLIAGWHGLVTVSRAVATVLGGLLPFLIPLAVIGFAVLWIRRGRRGRSVMGESVTYPQAGPAGSGLPTAAAGDALDGGPDVHQVDQDADQGNQP